eukprot:3568032-Rhodomonas_salina.1
MRTGIPVLVEPILLLKLRRGAREALGGHVQPCDLCLGDGPDGPLGQRTGSPVRVDAQVIDLNHFTVGPARHVVAEGDAGGFAGARGRGDGAAPGLLDHESAVQVEMELVVLFVEHQGQVPPHRAPVEPELVSNPEARVLRDRIPSGVVPPHLWTQCEQG